MLVRQWPYRQWPYVAWIGPRARPCCRDSAFLFCHVLSRLVLSCPAPFRSVLSPFCPVPHKMRERPIFSSCDWSASHKMTFNTCMGILWGNFAMEKRFL